MARYCKSCGSISKTQIPLFIAFIAVFLGKISVFVILHCTDIHIYRQTHLITLPRCAHARCGVMTDCEYASYLYFVSGYFLSLLGGGGGGGGDYVRTPSCMRPQKK